MKKTKKPAAQPSQLITQVEELAELLERRALDELDVEEGGLRIRLRRGGTTIAAGAPNPAPVATPAPRAASAADSSDGNISYITSPFVGTFYRSPNPDSAPFVDTGTRVRKGQVLCIVEAMKLMNEIECEVDGVIVQCLVENGHPVEYGEPLFKIKQE